MPESIPWRDAVGAAWKIVGAICMVLGGWAFTVLLGVQSDVAVLKQTVNYFASDRYRADEARRDFELRDLKISTVQAAINGAQSRIDALEREVHSTNTKVEEIAPPVRRRPQ